MKTFDNFRGWLGGVVRRTNTQNVVLVFFVVTMLLYILYMTSCVLILTNDKQELREQLSAVRSEQRLMARGDLNHDGVVDNGDLGLLYTSWSAKTPLLVGDLNHDGTIDDKDAAILFAHWSDRTQQPQAGTH